MQCSFRYRRSIVAISIFTAALCQPAHAARWYPCWMVSLYAKGKSHAHLEQYAKTHKLTAEEQAVLNEILVIQRKADAAYGYV